MDGNLDYKGLDTRELLDILRHINRFQYPINYGRLKAALEEAGFVVEETAAGFISASRPNTVESATEFPVRFSPGRGLLAWIEPARNDFRLIGSGHIDVGKTRVHVEGRRLYFVFGLAFQNRFELLCDHIVNVEHASNVARLEYREPGRRTKALTVWTSDAASAERLAHVLPDMRTPDLEALLPAQVDFDERLRERTPNTSITDSLVILNVAVFLLMLLTGAEMLLPVGDVHVTWGSNFGIYTASGEWWRLLTSAFLHFGVIHLLFNMWALASMGPLVERLLGSAAYTSVYLFAAVTGNLASISWQPMVNSAGASGAIFGLYGALLAVLLRGREYVPRAILAPMRNFTLIFVVYALGSGFTRKGVDNAAHVGGLIAGFALGYFLARPWRDARGSGIRHANLASAAAIGALLLAGGFTLAQHRGSTLQGDALYYQTQRWFVRAEKVANDHYNDAWRRVRQDTMDDDGLAQAIELLILPTWREADQRLSRIELEPESDLRNDLALLRELTASRRKANELCVKGARLHDSKILKDCRAEMDHGNELIEHYPQASGK